MWVIINAEFRTSKGAVHSCIHVLSKTTQECQLLHKTFGIFLDGYLATLPASRPYSVDDRMIDER
jgi:hypothetical protein